MCEGRCWILLLRVLYWRLPHPLPDAIRVRKLSLKFQYHSSHLPFFNRLLLFFFLRFLIFLIAFKSNSTCGILTFFRAMTITSSLFWIQNQSPRCSTRRLPTPANSKPRTMNQWIRLTFLPIYLYTALHKVSAIEPGSIRFHSPARELLCITFPSLE